MRVNPSLRRFCNLRTLWAILAIAALASLLNLATIWGFWTPDDGVADTLRRIASAWMRRPVGVPGTVLALVGFYASTCLFLAALLAALHDDADLVARPVRSGLMLAALMLLQVRMALLPMPAMRTPEWTWIAMTCLGYAAFCVTLIFGIRWLAGRPTAH